MKSYVKDNFGSLMKSENGLLVLLALVMTFVFSPATSFAFSLGQIRVTGAFSEQFRAEIPVKVDGKTGLMAWIGSKRDYDKLGIKIPHFINKLKLKLDDHPTLPGQKIVYIVSSEPIYQPSFNLVIKAALGGGVILENYFLAVDFQKNLALDLPSGENSEKMAIARLAEELQAIKQFEMIKETPLDRISREEAEAMARERSEEPPSVALAEKAPPKIEKPAAPVIAEKPKKTDKPVVPVIEYRPKKVKPKKIEKPVPRVVAPITYINTQPAKVTKSASGLLPISSDPTVNIHKVRAGNSLYRIARSLGAKKADYNRVVVALWKTNINAFIHGNMHGLRVDAMIDYNEVNEIAKAMTNEEAKKLIDEQWPLWQEYVKKATAKKKARFAKKKAETAKVVIESSTLAALTNKIAEIKEPNIIATEEKQESLAYIAHVASYKKRESALKLVRFLRKKGLNAFETTNASSKGSWSRVLVGRHTTFSDATNTGDKMKSDGISQHIRILMLPYAIQVGQPATTDMAKSEIGRLLQLGISAYTAEDANGLTLVLTGAFDSKNSAVEAIKSLSSHGLVLTVVKP